jgi:hypothetical protein
LSVGGRFVGGVWLTGALFRVSGGFEATVSLLLDLSNKTAATPPPINTNSSATAIGAMINAGLMPCFFGRNF